MLIKKWLELLGNSHTKRHSESVEPSLVLFPELKGMWFEV